MPLDRRRTAQWEATNESVRIDLGIDLSRQIEKCAACLGTVPSAVLLAAWATVLCRLSRQDDLVIGAGRTRESSRLSTENAHTGVDLLSLELNLAEASTGAELMSRVGVAISRAMSQQNLNVDELVGLLEPERRLSHTPMVQTLFVWQCEAERICGLDLVVTLGEQKGVISGAIAFSSALFDRATIVRWTDYLKKAVVEMISSPDQPVLTLPLLSSHELHLVLVEWNATSVPYPEHLCVHQLFEAQVERDPGAVALVFGTRSLTYEELNTRANQLARHLRRLGAGADCLVGLCVERSPGMVIGILAALKAGAAYLPLDPDHPLQRLSHMIDEGSPIALLHDANSREIVEATLMSTEIQPPVLNLDEDAARWSNEDTSNLEPSAIGLSSANLSYVLYTSGSTGMPKGVMTEHKALVNRLIWMQSEYKLDTSDVVIQKTPFTFDVSVWEFFWPLCWGARLFIAAPGVHRDPEKLGDAIIAGGVTIAHFVPSMLGIFLQHARVKSLRGLTRVMCSGEALSAPLVEVFHEMLPWAQLHNLYGPTEAAIDVTAWTSTGRLPPGVDTPLIGRPISNIRIYLLDEQMRPVPLGASGEIFIGGAGVARGYLNRPELTSERFRNSPFVAGDRLYKTGDVGRYLSDGMLEHLGRNDSQVKLRGYRIELGEVEARLRACPGVGEAAVWVSGATPAQRRLIACYTTAEGVTRPTQDTLRAWMSAVLPDYMVPSSFVALPVMPLTANGKLDRSALSEHAASDVSVVPVSPGTREEILVCSLVANLLGVERVSVTDNFFHIGGDSLLAARLSAQLRLRFARALPVSAIFEHPVLQKLARYLAGSDASENTVSDAFKAVLPIRQVGVQPPLFCLYPVGGLSWPYTALLPFTQDSQPIYGIQASGHEPGTVLPQSVDEIVEACLGGVRQIAPEGAVRLLGWSFGGILAHLVATRLQAEGRKVDRLIMFDAYPPIQRNGWSYADDLRGDGLWRDLAFALDLEVPASVPGGALDATIVMELARDQSHSLAALSHHQLDRFGAVMANNTRLMSDIRFESFRGDIVFVAASLRAPGFNAELMNPAKWQPYCKGAIHLQIIRSTHNRMLSPESLLQVEFLADARLGGRGE
jgi:amino acid adenylation domain-containing protein